MAVHPNVVWIQTDEQRPDSLGCYGSAWARTPNVDGLASRGTLFQNTVCQSPVCVPSRSSQLACRYPQELNTCFNDVGVAELDTSADVLSGGGDVFPAGTITFPEVLQREAGYETVTFGKVHTPRHPTWGHVYPLVNDDTYSGYYDLNPDYSDASYNVLKRPGSTPIILAGTYPSCRDNPSRTITDQAIDWLRGRDREVPFLLRVSHNWPHTPVLPPPPFDRLYAPEELPVRFYDDEAYRSRAHHDREAAERDRMRDLTPAQVRQVWKDYMGLCAYVDHEVGRLLGMLRALRLHEDTVVIYSSDHGKALGEWGAGEKGYFDQQVWRVPFVWSWPGHVSESVVRTEPCELIDTGRTLLSLLGLGDAAPSAWRGRDLFATTATPDGAVFGQIGWPNAAASIPRRARQAQHRPIDSRWHTLRMAVRTDQYRMDESWMRDGQRIPAADADGNLFDLDADPQERHNLWHHPAHQDTVSVLRAHLENWFTSLERPSETFSSC